LPSHKALPSHEYVAGQLLSLLNDEVFAKIALVDGHPDKVASRFLESFTPLRGFSVDHLGELAQKGTLVGVKLLLVARNWLGIEDENLGNIGALSQKDGTLFVTRVDYDTSFYGDTYELRPVDFNIRGIEALDEDALIHAFSLVADILDDLMREKLVEIYSNIDRVGVDFSAEKRNKLENFLALRKQAFQLRRDALILNKKILKFLQRGDALNVQRLYSIADENIRRLVQCEWLLEHTVRTRSEYAELVAHFPEILDNWELMIADNRGSATTPLHISVEWRLASLVEHLLNTCSDLKAVGHRGDERMWTPLHIAADNGCDTCIKSILSTSLLSSLKLKNEKGQTPLHLAAESGHVDSIGYLVDAGASLSIKDTQGNTPFLAACKKGKQTSAMALLNRGSDLMAVNEAGQTALHLSSMGDSESLCEVLIENNPHFVNVQDDMGRTALHLAAIHQNLSVMHCLIAHGASLFTQDHRGWTVAHLIEVLSLDFEMLMLKPDIAETDVI
tara:strand:- start:554 stop:2065 length:1512 start_codon:yes stop_codon:yes gene_type:complete